MFTVLLVEVLIGVVQTERKLFKKEFSREKILTIAKEKNFEVLFEGEEFIVVKEVSPFYVDGTKKVKYYRFMTEDFFSEFAEEI